MLRRYYDQIYQDLQDARSPMKTPALICALGPVERDLLRPPTCKHKSSKRACCLNTTHRRLALPYKH